MGLSMRHVVWCSATLSLGAFFYVLTLEPMDRERNPRAAVFDRAPSRSNLIVNIRNSLAQGQMQAADRQSMALIQNNPEDLAALYYRAHVLRAMGQDEAAQPFWDGLWNLTKGLESWEGRYSIEQIDYHRAWAMHGVGRAEESREVFARIADRLEARSQGSEGGINSPLVHYNLACYRSMSGDLDRALLHFGRAIELGYSGGMDGSGWWMVDPDLEPLHEFDAFWAIGSDTLDIPQRDKRSDERNEGSEGIGDG